VNKGVASFRAVIPRVVIVALACSVAVVAACDSGGDGSSTAQEPTGEGGDVQPAASKAVRLKRIGSFDQPTYVTSPPGDTRRLYVVEQPGRIKVMVDGKARSKPFLDIGSDVNCCGERGLFSMAFAADYAKSKRFYVYFTGDDGDVRVQQFLASSSTAADRGSRRDVLRLEHSQFPNHNGGQLQTGPDGRLWLATGDGGGGGDPNRNAQKLSVVYGKLLRIAPRSGGGYGIPSDNPFRGTSGARGEIWAYGLRNPYRFTFDRQTHALTIGDVGQDTLDEVDHPAKRGKGANFGWSVFEGTRRFRSGDAPGHVKPVLVNRLHENGNCALIGGYVVRDSKLASLAGRYLFGDNCNPRIYSVKLSTKGASGRSNTGLTVNGLSSFGQDGAGHVYLTSLGGPVYRLVAR
jgi:glucose/arabinose dehydrogenase